MKVFKYLFSAVAFCCGMTLTSCSNDDEVADSTAAIETADNAITFSEPFLESMTRSAITSTNFRNQTAEVLACRQVPGEGYDTEWVLQSDLSLSYNSGWQSTPAAYWYGDHYYYFVGVMPYSVGVEAIESNGVAWGKISSLPLAGDIDEIDDVLFTLVECNKTMADQTGGVQLAFSHIYNKLSFSWDKTPEAAEDGVTATITDATLYVPTGSTRWIQNKFMYTDISNYSNFSQDLSSESTNNFNKYYKSISLTPMVSSGTMEENILIAGHNTWTEENANTGAGTVNVYLDVTYDLKDADGALIGTYTASKQLIELDQDYAPYDGGKSTNINIKFDTSDKLSAISFVASYIDWTDSSSYETTVE